MPARLLHIDGRDWRIYPSGFLTQYVADEFGLIFVHGSGADREVRVTRYSPVAMVGVGREQTLASMDDAQLMTLFRTAQPGARSPEAGYRS